MALLENLAQGFANAAGATDAAAGIQKNKNDRAATQHEELQARSQMIWDDVKRLQDRRAALDPKSPTYKKDLSDIDSSLEQHQQAFIDLYHPAKNPGALAKLGGFLRAHIGGQKQPQVPSTPAQAKQSMAQLQATAAGGGQTPGNPLEQKVKELEGIGVPHDEAVRIASGQKEPTQRPTWKQFKVGDQIKWYDLNDKESIPPDAQPIQSGAGAIPKVGSLGDFLIREYGPNPTPEQITKGKALFAQAGAGTTTGTHMITVPQPDGSIKVYQVETTSTKTFPAARQSAPSVPKTPGEARSRVNPPSSDTGRLKPGDTVGGRLTAPQSKAKTEYDTAVGLSAKADEVAKHPNDAVNQKRLAVALERASAGRFTTQALDYIIKAGWGNTIEQWVNNPTTGALPADIMRQLVDGAHQEVIDKKAALDASGYKDPNAKPVGDEDDDKFLRQIK